MLSLTIYFCAHYLLSSPRKIYEIRRLKMIYFMHKTFREIFKKFRFKLG